MASADSVGTAKAELTVTDAMVEFTAAPLLSVIWRMKLQLPVAVELEVTKV